MARGGPDGRGQEGWGVEREREGYGVGIFGVYAGAFGGTWVSVFFLGRCRFLGWWANGARIGMSRRCWRVVGRTCLVFR